MNTPPNFAQFSYQRLIEICNEAIAHHQIFVDNGNALLKLSEEERVNLNIGDGAFDEHMKYAKHAKDTIELLCAQITYYQNQMEKNS